MPAFEIVREIAAIRMYHATIEAETEAEAIAKADADWKGNGDIVWEDYGTAQLDDAEHALIEGED